MGSYDLYTAPEQGGQTPSLQMDATAGGRKGRYPNQFFDLAQQYMPPTMSELLRWCTFYFYNSPLIGSAITKLSRYPITDLIIEDEHESIRDMWDRIFNKVLKIKGSLLEVNLDHFVYGNAFVSLHLPFIRFLVCGQCNNKEIISKADWSFDSSSYSFRFKCKCGHSGSAGVKDVTYKDMKGVKLIRWNPENIRIKSNEYTGRKVYMYIVPYKLKNAVQRGDKDIVEDMPMIVLDAIKNRRMIRFNNDNIFHLRRPTLAEQDQGWGKPLIIHVLKDMYYLYTLRRAQEAIAMEHIVPFDIIYPMPNAQQDPYIHTDLAGWRNQIESMIMKHRSDPNYKAVIPIPVGFGRLGGDGKAMLLTPELNMLAQQIVGGMGIPSEFLFGGLSWTGSSVSLRTLENDFIQNRAQLLDLVHWIKDKLRFWNTLPDVKSLRFSDFRMADDIQRNQQLIGLNAQQKVSDQTLLTELGYNYDQEVKKMIEEVYVMNYLNDIRGKGQAKTQGETMLINQQYQDKIQKMVMEAQQNAQSRIGALQGQPQVEAAPGDLDPNQAPGPAGAGAGQQGEQPQEEAQGQGGQPPQGAPGQADAMADKLLKASPQDAATALQELKTKYPDLGTAVEKAYQAKKGGGGDTAPNMNPLPEQKQPRREGAI